jgi:hypothetical protein
MVGNTLSLHPQPQGLRPRSLADEAITQGPSSLESGDSLTPVMRAVPTDDLFLPSLTGDATKVDHISRSFLPGGNCRKGPDLFHPFSRLAGPSALQPDNTGSKPAGSTPSSTETLASPNYPPNLPPPELLFHLIEVFFTSVPLSNQLLRKPTLLMSLDYARDDSRFPSIALFHAICGLASLYSPVTAHLEPVVGLPIRLFRKPEEIGTQFPGIQIELAGAYETFESRTGKYTLQNLQGASSRGLKSRALTLHLRSENHYKLVPCKFCVRSFLEQLSYIVFRLQPHSRSTSTLYAQSPA